MVENDTDVETAYSDGLLVHLNMLPISFVVRSGETARIVRKGHLGADTRALYETRGSVSNR